MPGQKLRLVQKTAPGLFGFSNSPAVFQALMSVVLQGCNDFSTAYLDDNMIFSPTLEEHLKHICIIFDKLRQHNLKLKLKKCSFLKSETNYLGFVVSEEVIKLDQKKIEAIRSLPVPTFVIYWHVFLLQKVYSKPTK